MRGGWTQKCLVRLSILLVSLAAFDQGASAQQLQARAAIEKRQVYVGEPFVLQIQIEGSESPKKPDLGSLTDFQVQDIGGQQNSSESVTIVNGRTTRAVRRGYIFSYRLTAKKAGTLAIPSIAVNADGQTVRTQPVPVRAVPPSETDDFKLRLSLSELKAYVGQPVTMTVTWYVGKDVREFAFNVPILNDSRFEVVEPKILPEPNRHLRVPLNETQTIAEKGRGNLGSKEYLTVRFQRVLFPKQPGKITFPRSTVACESLEGYQRSRRRSLGDDLFDKFFNDDFFSFGRRAVYENHVIPSNSPTLEVLELPRAGRPANFSGLVGNYRVTAQANPTEVNVGDPITLTVRVSGPSYVGNVELPALEGQPALSRDFKIPKERAAGVVEGDAKKFTQTIRAENSDVQQIPPIEISYFDPKKGAYETARTEAIPITVKGARIVTARDAEGFTEAAPVQAAIESSESGIGYNYEGPDVLVNQDFGPAAWLRSPGWLVALGAPPLVYVGLLGFTVFTRLREADPAARRAKRAFRELSKELRLLEAGDSDEHYAAVLEVLRRYLGNKLGLAYGALTFADVKPVLEQRNVDDGTIQALRQLFERCEAGRYTGAAYGDRTPTALGETALETAKKLERVLT